VAEFPLIQSPFLLRRGEESLGKEGTGDGPSSIYFAIPPDQEGTGLLELKDKSLNPWIFVHRGSSNLIVRPEEIGGPASDQEGGRYQVDHADADVEPFIHTAETLAPIWARKLGVPVEQSSSIFDITPQPQAPLY
jgi:hypothetical protein